MDSREFLILIRGEKLSGKEFLSLLGNTKISNAGYTEIRDSQALTLQRLTDILDENGLIDRDFQRIMTAAKELNKQKRLYPNGLPQPTAPPDSNSPKTLQETKTVPEQPETKPAQDLRFKPPVIPDDGEDDGFVEESGDEDYADYDDDDSDRTNTAKIIITMVLGVIMLLSTVVMNFSYTGSLLPPPSGNSGVVKHIKSMFKAPETPKEAAALLKKLTLSGGGYGSVKDAALQDERYYLDSREAENIRLTDFFRYNSTVFSLSGNRLKSYGLADGAVSELSEYTLDNETALGFAVCGELLYLISTGTYSGNYFSLALPDESDSGGLPLSPDNITAGDYTRNYVSVRIFDVTADTGLRPVSQAAVDGDYNNVIFANNAAYIITDYAPISADDDRYPLAYTPCFSLRAEEKSLIPPTSIFFPESAASAQMTIFARINASDFEIKAAVGGKGRAYTGADAFVLSQWDGGTTRVAAFDVRELTLTGYYDISGNQIISCGQQSGTVRAASQHGMYIFGLESSGEQLLPLLSRTENIAAGKDVKAALFDDERAYYVSEGALYLFDISIPDDPLPSTDAVSFVYGDSYLPFGKGRRIAVEPLGSSSSGISVFSAERGVLSQENAVELIGGPPETDLRKSVYADDSGLAIIPLVYHDGVSKVERFVILDYATYGGFTQLGEIIYYDWNSDRLRATALGDYVYTFWDDRIVTAKISPGGVTIN